MMLHQEVAVRVVAVAIEVHQQVERSQVAAEPLDKAMLVVQAAHHLVGQVAVAVLERLVLLVAQVLVEMVEMELLLQ